MTARIASQALLEAIDGSRDRYHRCEPSARASRSKAAFRRASQSRGMRDMEARVRYLAVLRNVNGHLRVAFNASDRINHDCLGGHELPFKRRNACRLQGESGRTADRPIPVNDVRGRRAAGHKDVHRNHLMHGPRAVEESGNDRARKGRGTLTLSRKRDSMMAFTPKGLRMEGRWR